MTQSGLLFNSDIPVSEKEVSDWLDTIPNLSAKESRRQAYRIAYNVDNKIRATKTNQYAQNNKK